MNEFLGKAGLIFVKAIGSLPFPVIYFVSDILYLFLFRLGGYRKNVVRSNIRHSFPEKSEAEVRQIADQFFRYLADLIMEGLKMHSITEEELRERMKLENLEACNALYDQGKSILIVCAHYANFEYGAIRYTLDAQHRVNTVYKPLTNQVFDGYMQSSRSKFGTFLVPMRKTYEVLSQEQNDGILSGTGLVSDQAPNPIKGYWMKFLNQDTPVFMGCEAIAKKMDFPVVYAEVNYLKRGHYVLRFEPLFLNPGKTEPGEITEKFTLLFEECIRREPAYWLWSHKRWKHRVPADLPESQKSKNYPIG